MRSAILLSIFLLSGLPDSAQQASQFDVALLKPDQMPVVVPDSPGPKVFRAGLEIDPAHGIARCHYCSLQSMIGMAWDLKPYQILGPDWVVSDQYGLDARMPEGTSTATALLMLQTLLLERFQLTLRRDERPYPTWSLVITPSTALKLTKADAAGNKSQSGNGIIADTGLSMDGLARSLSPKAGRPVINATGLEGFYDVKLTWQPQPPDEPPPGTELLRALREQLGFTLQSSKTNLPVITVEKALKIPIPN